MQSRYLGSAGTFGNLGSGKLNDFLQILLFSNVSSELLAINKVLKDVACVHVVLLREGLTETGYELVNSVLLLGFDLVKNLLVVVGLKLSQQFVQNFGDRLLVHVLNQFVDDVALRGENVGHQHLLLATVEE